MLYGSRKGINNPASLRCFTDGGCFHFRYDQIYLWNVIRTRCFSRYGGIQSTSRDLVFQLLEFSIHKPTSSPLELSLCTRSCHPFNTKNGFIKREAFRLLTTNSVKDNCYKHKRDFEFEQRLSNRSYPTALVHKILTEVQFSDRTEAFPNKTKKAKEIWPFATTDNRATPNHMTFG